MGSVEPFEKSSKRRKEPGKIDAPLGEKLQAVKWGEYKVGDLFRIQKITKMLSKEDTNDNLDFPVYSSESTNNGIIGYTDTPEFICNEETPVYITFGDHTRTLNIAEKSFSVLDNVKVLLPCTNNILALLFMIATSQKQIPNLGYSRHWKVAKDCVLSLPTTANNEIDFDFMESFIRELEEERIRELQSYLAVTGLSDYTLTLSEQDALKGFEALEWREFNVTDVFNVKNTHNILSSEIAENSGGVPYLCASAENNGVSSYISYNADFLEDGNCIFIGGKTFVVSYQKDDFFSNDSHNLALYLKDFEADKSNQLYLATCIRKSLAHKYSWGNSISNAKIKGDKVMLPVRDGEPDYEAMQDFISAVQKLVIKDVVKYAEDKINATKKVVKNKDEYKTNEDKSFLSVAESADYKEIPR